MLPREAQCFIWGPFFTNGNIFSVFHQHRQLLKDSFMVELVEGARKLRHVFLFTDLFLCAKLKKQIGG